MRKEKLIDYKEYARQMRENCARDYNGTEPIVICSSELWEKIATVIEGFDKQSEGEWKWISDDDCICSACGRVFYSADNADAGTGLWKFCPNCGAKMRKEDEGK